MTHLGFILAAYGATVVVFAALIIWVIRDTGEQKRKLKQLEAEGAVRRSARVQR
jgi:heme exporter protein D